MAAALRCGGPFPPSQSEPYIRPASPLTGRRTAPQGWVVQSIGNWNGTPHEVVYDPRCFDITIGPADHPPRPATVWKLKASDGPRRFWIQDRATATRDAFRTHDSGTISARLNQRRPPSPPASGRGL
jgi:hypothetical protein